MKKKLALLLAILALSFPAESAQAHPADMYFHAFHIRLTGEGITVQWDVRTGPLLASWIWNQTDADLDAVISREEADAWGAVLAPLLETTLDGGSFPLHLDDVYFPAQIEYMQAGIDFPYLILSAAWPQEMADEAALSFYSSLDAKNASNWFEVSALDPAAFRYPSQRTCRLDIEVVRNRAALPDTGGLFSAWDSDTTVPREDDAADQPAPTPASAAPSAQDILTGLVSQEDISFTFYLIALGVSVVLGALHALTPGHGKTIVAAYLVGTRGTPRHAVALGIIVTLTHTGTVLLLGLVTLVASRYILPSNILPVLEVLSGLLIVSLGVYLLAQRLREWRHSRMHLHGKAHRHEHEHHEHHEHPHDHSHEHGHSHEIPDALTWRSLTALGISGGLVPCPDAIAILLVAIAINRMALGLALIVSFSLGLAAVLIVIGLVMVSSRRLFDRLEILGRFTPVLPVAGAVVVLLMGAVLTYGASARLLGG